MIATVDTLFAEGYLGPLDRRFAAALGRLAGEADPLVLLGAAVTSRFTGHKHVCADLDRICGRPVRDDDGKPIGDLTWPERAPWMRALESCPLVGRGGTPTPLVIDEIGRLYLYRYWSYQQRLLEALGRLTDQGPEREERALLREGLEREFPPTEDADPDLQRRAAQLALERRLAVISGGPGTGKTATVARILALLIEQSIGAGGEPPRITLMAPTGKAAARLSESIGQAKRAVSGAVLGCADEVRALIPEQAATIHRTLGWQPRTPTRFRHHRDNPLPTDVVVVDEASMVDLALMTKLVEAVPAGARLMLLGDRDQLASVDAGAVLGDICGAGLDEVARADSTIGDHIVHLTHSYRFGARSPLGRLARAINGGRSAEALELLSGDAAGPLRLIEPTGDRGGTNAVEALALERYRPLFEAEDPASRLAALDRFRVLCAHRVGLWGAETINASIECALLDAGARTVAGDWYPGRPVLVVENDYQVNLFNGDVGVTDHELEQSGPLRVYFDGPGAELRSLAPSRLPGHKTVYAMTIHKSQGSEFDEVVVVLPDRQSPVLTREALYTAVTRARERVTVIGDPRLVEAAIRARIERSSGLRDVLWGVESDPGRD